MVPKQILLFTLQKAGVPKIVLITLLLIANQKKKDAACVKPNKCLVLSRMHRCIAIQQLHRCIAIQQMQLFVRLRVFTSSLLATFRKLSLLEGHLSAFTLQSGSTEILNGLVIFQHPLLIVVIVLCRIGLGEDHPFGFTTLGAFKKQYVCTSLCQSSYDVGRMYSLVPHHFAL